MTSPIDFDRPASAARRPRRVALLLALALALGFAGCPSGSRMANGGMSGTGISQGKITAFGSIYVNAVRWNVSGATIEIDDAVGAEGDLRLGMVVRVEGRVAAGGLEGTATRVVFDELLEGPIDGAPVDVDPGITRSFVVLGMTVVVHVDKTHFDDGATFAGLAAGDLVAVSGFVDGNGVIQATRVERNGVFQAGVSQGEIEGPIEMLNTGAGTFEIGGALVTYDATGLLTQFQDLAPGDLQDGLLIEVEGTLTALDEIDAVRIEREDAGLGGGDIDEVELEGLVSGFTSLSADFQVAGVTVDGSMASLHPSGLLLANGLEVEVHGRLEAGRLIADEIESEEDDDESAGIRAAITSIDHAARSLVALGVTVDADTGTELEDERDHLPNFRFDDIAVGDWLEIEGGATGPGRMRAKQIKRRAVENDVRLQGPVTAFDPVGPTYSLSILDQSIPIDGGTQYQDLLGPTTPAAFFGALALDDIVEATDQNAASPDVLAEADGVELDD